VANTPISQDFFRKMTRRRSALILFDTTVKGIPVLLKNKALMGCEAVG
jgi:hypothetical protein